jgi:prepilin-type N-terminal cleavage/methylation domain-containing protein
MPSKIGRKFSFFLRNVPYICSNEGNRSHRCDDGDGPTFAHVAKKGAKNMKRKKLWQDETGFTLMEMLLVLFIMGIIMAIAIPNLKAVADKAKDRADLANRQLIAAQVDNYYLEYGEYPATVADLVKTGFLQKVPTCPTGQREYTINPSPNLPAEKRVTCKKE